MANLDKYFLNLQANSETKMRKGLHLILYMVVAVMVTVTCSLTSGCTADGSSKNDAEHQHVAQPSDTLYTEQKAMAVYDYQPERALQIVDSAVIVGNVSETWADILRMHIYCYTIAEAQVDSLLGGPEGVRYEKTLSIGERLMAEDDSVRVSLTMQQNVLESMFCAAHHLERDEQAIRLAQQLVEVCHQQGAETEALRNEAEIGVQLCHKGEAERGLARIDSVIGLLDPVKFNELDATIIALKRKIIVLNTMERYAETISPARRILDLLGDYEQRPDAYHDGTYREPKDSTDRADYIAFYRSQAQSSMVATFAKLGESQSVEETFAQIDRSVREAVGREHIARYQALQRQSELERKHAELKQQQTYTLLGAIIAVLAVAFAVYFWRQRSIVAGKNRALVRQIDEAMRYRDKYGTMVTEEAVKPADSADSATPDAQLFAQIHDAIIREQLYLNPACDRRMLTDRFQLSKERLGALFAQYSESKNISAFINALRLDHASRLLTSQPDMDIRLVASESGFSSHQYFSNCFKQCFGLSPSDYRKAKFL